MRRARRVDANQDEIVLALRSCGASVEVLSEVGRGVPDLLVGHRFKTYLVEVKTDKGALSREQHEWHTRWRGSPVLIVRSVDEALTLLGVSSFNAAGGHSEA